MKRKIAIVTAALLTLVMLFSSCSGLVENKSIPVVTLEQSGDLTIICKLTGAEKEEDFDLISLEYPGDELAYYTEYEGDTMKWYIDDAAAGQWSLSMPAAFEVIAEITYNTDPIDLTEADTTAEENNQ